MDNFSTDTTSLTFQTWISSWPPLFSPPCANLVEHHIWHCIQCSFCNLILDLDWSWSLNTDYCLNLLLSQTISCLQVMESVWTFLWLFYLNQLQITSENSNIKGDIHTKLKQIIMLCLMMNQINQKYGIFRNLKNKRSKVFECNNLILWVLFFHKNLTSNKKAPWFFYFSSICGICCQLCDRMHL